MAENKVTFGIRGVVVAPLTITTTATGYDYTYGDFVALPGAVSLTATMSGGTSNVYADDSIYTSTFSYAGQNVTLNLFELSDTFKKNYLGYIETADGTLVETTDFTPSNFALGFILSGDVNNKKVIFQNCTVAPTVESTTTKTDSTTPNEISLEITAMPVLVDERYVIKTSKLSTKSGYDTFLSGMPTLPTLPTN